MDPLKRYIVIAVAIFSVAAVILSGFGGLAADGPGRKVLGACAAFCLLMLLVPWTFAGTLEGPRWVEPLVAAAGGALVGLCGNLYFAPGEGWGTLFLHLVLGAALGLVVWVRYWLKSRLWNVG
jgi:hypothetical protein